MTFSHQAIFMLKPQLYFKDVVLISHIYVYTYIHTRTYVGRNSVFILKRHKKLLAI